MGLAGIGAAVLVSGFDKGHYIVAGLVVDQLGTAAAVVQTGDLDLDLDSANVVGRNVHHLP